MYFLFYRQQSAYICNFHDHWLTIRKIGYQWFNLNSLLTGPELISDTFLALYLAQLQEEGNNLKKNFKLPFNRNMSKN